MAIPPSLNGARKAAFNREPSPKAFYLSCTWFDIPRTWRNISLEDLDESVGIAINYVILL